ncbi:hypothetical protein [Streptomyces sp. 8L]|uniref:hypothetical protein n=1 Tax=Streptomyces sp. 8L TaxID=2877242 RepID=UPI001CD275AF|nr:hypothetical protein [Streptomyces sp. 8L]MCA1220598.1 hypothetical protein [Streptomyces sp. 8L]
MKQLEGPAGPVTHDAGQWLTLPDCKKVLFVVHTEVYGQRLRELLPLFESDLRVQVAYTVAPHAFNRGADRALNEVGGGVALPWQEAVNTEFDLALAAGSQGMEQVRAPLIRMPHGAGHIKLSRRPGTATGGHGDGERAVGGLGRGYLTFDGRVVPTALALAHRADLEVLARECPEALPIATVVGDGSFDRIRASLPWRDRYRAALGLRAGQRLVLVTMTWGQGSSFNRLDALLPRLVAELPGDAYRIAVLVHPNVRAGHGDWQVNAWLAGFRRQGVAVLDAGADWRTHLIAADWIIGDHGSVTLYGTLTQAAILLARFPSADVNPASPGAELGRAAPALSPAHPLPQQLRYAAETYPAAEYARIASLISSEPGRFDRRMRDLMYRVLRLGPPAYDPAPGPLPLPGRLAAAVVDRPGGLGLSA